MKVQCIDAQSAETIVHHAAQHRLQDHGVSISAEGNTLSVVPTNAFVGLLSNAIGMMFGLFLTRPEREADQQQAVNGGTTTP
ncbi:hypothetical protein [Billgrantia endophytica]|uniref:Uncharacterized protein n=1 Tax=Billgrantia endophytica TaxID=2033802 RepID=A0A2N7U0U4_9GAMM|nr:hypothetical protein [Halomonas endophytica]PMR74033.1 hypothetical protein C1H69_15285 [Halomonas endophytica]